jgi:dimethylargininase
MPVPDQVSVLRRVLVRAPQADALDAWRASGWHGRPDAQRAAAEHGAFRALLAGTGAEVVQAAQRVPGDPDAIYVYDPVLTTPFGVIALRPGKTGRRGEVDPTVHDLEALGYPVIGRLTDPACAEGGDCCWLDASTLLVGRGYRTNDAGEAALRSILEPRGVEVLAFDLPHLDGPGRCLHLLSLFSPLAPDLAVGHRPLMPVRLLGLLERRGVSLVEVPAEELATMGPNVLALAPRVVVALEGNPVTRRRLEEAGVEVRTYRGDEISRRGDGGPTCLTLPLERG